MSIHNIPLSQIFPFLKQRYLKFWQRLIRLKPEVPMDYRPLYSQDRNRNVQNTEHYVQSSQAEHEATQSLENSSCSAHPQECVERNLSKTTDQCCCLTLKARYLRNASTKNCPRTSPSVFPRNNTGFYDRDQCTRTFCYS